MKKELTLFQVNTTAYDEEDFLIVTDLNEDEIIKVITPIVEDERDNDVLYDNEQLVWALRNAYPKAIIYDYYPNSIETISI